MLKTPPIRCVYGAAPLLLLAACTAEPDEAPEPPPPEESPEESPDAEETGPEEPEGPDLDDALVRDGVRRGGSDHVIFAAPDDPCGEPLLSADTPIDGLGFRWAYSADWRYAAHEVADGIQVSKLDVEEAEYAEEFLIDPGEDTYSEHADDYLSPVFSPDGATLWFHVESDEETVWASIPYQDYTAGDEPDVTDREDEGGDVEPQLEFDEDDVPHFVYRTEDENDEIVDGDLVASYWHDINGDLAGIAVEVHLEGEFVLEYLGVSEIAPNELLVRANHEGIGMVDLNREAADRYGGLALATIDPDSGAVDLEEVVPVDVDYELPEWVRLLPDDTTVYMSVGGTPYSASLDSPGEEPEELDSEESCFVGGSVYWP